MEKYFDDLAKRIKTKEELISFLEDIIKVRQIIFKNKDGLLSSKVEGKVNEELKKLIAGLEKKKVISKSAEKQAVFCERLEKYLQSLPQLKLEIAFHPQESSIVRISEWIKKELGDKTIIDLNINPKIIGGAIIEHQGNWRDFSLSKEIDSLVSQK
jgi:F0F1-type ATP synthase delta subunit